MNVLKEKLKQLQFLIIENSSVTISKEELNLEIECLKNKNEILNEENIMYKNQINKVKKARKMFLLYTSIYYIAMISLVVINLSSGLFLKHILYTIGSFSGLAMLYLYASYDEVKILSRNDIRFYKKIIKNNNMKINENDIKINNLDKDLRDLIERNYKLKQALEKSYQDLNMICNKDTYIQNIDNKEEVFQKVLKK